MPRLKNSKASFKIKFKSPSKKKHKFLLVSILLFLAGFFIIRSEFFWGFFRGVSYKNVINHYSGVYKFDPLFVMAIVKVESNFRKKAKSQAGAVGLMQLLKGTAMEMAEDLGIENLSEADLEKPEINIRLGFHYLNKLKEQFGGNEIEILAAYNAGKARVLEWKKNKANLELDDIAFPETRSFVEQVLNNHKWLKRFQRVANFIRKK